MRGRAAAAALIGPDSKPRGFGTRTGALPINVWRLLRQADPTTDLIWLVSGPRSLLPVAEVTQESAEINGALAGGCQMLSRTGKIRNKCRAFGYQVSHSRQPLPEM